MIQVVNGGSSVGVTKNKGVNAPIALLKDLESAIKNETGHVVTNLTRESYYPEDSSNTITNLPGNSNSVFDDVKLSDGSNPSLVSFSESGKYIALMSSELLEIYTIDYGTQTKSLFFQRSTTTDHPFSDVQWYELPILISGGNNDNQIGTRDIFVLTIGSYGWVLYQSRNGYPFSIDFDSSTTTDKALYGDGIIEPKCYIMRELAGDTFSTYLESCRLALVIAIVSYDDTNRSWSNITLYFVTYDDNSDMSIGFTVGVNRFNALDRFVSSNGIKIYGVYPLLSLNQQNGNPELNIIITHSNYSTTNTYRRIVRYVIDYYNINPSTGLGTVSISTYQFLGGINANSVEAVIVADSTSNYYSELWFKLTCPVYNLGLTNIMILQQQLVILPAYMIFTQRSNYVNSFYRMNIVSKLSSPTASLISLTSSNTIRLPLILSMKIDARNLTMIVATDGNTNIACRFHVFTRFFPVDADSGGINNILPPSMVLGVPFISGYYKNPIIATQHNPFSPFAILGDPVNGSRAYDLFKFSSDLPSILGYDTNMVLGPSSLQLYFSGDLRTLNGDSYTAITAGPVVPMSTEIPAHIITSKSLTLFSTI